MKYIIIILFIFMINSCNKINMENNNISKSQIIESVGVQNFENLKNTNEYILIDIRNPEELEMTGYIDGAINIPYYYPGFMNNIQNLDKNKKYLIYCNSGIRTGQTLRIMKAMGFNEAHHLEGGIQDWLNNNMNVTYCDNSGIC